MELAVPHPIPYQGSKRHLAKYILDYFPDGCTRLIEPFAGSAAVTLAALYNGKINHVVIGDSDIPLVNLWNEIINHPEKIVNSYRAHWNQQQGNERAYYDQVRSSFNQNHAPDDFLYLLARCVKAAVRYNMQGQFNQSPDNRRKGMHPDTMEKHIFGASILLKGKSVVKNTDYRDLVEALTLWPSDLIYLDPPYQGVCRNRDPRYRDSVLYHEFVEFLKFLNEKEMSFIVSYDGRTGDKAHGNLLPDFLELNRLEINAGRSSQATLLGRNVSTFESLYLSRALMLRLSAHPAQLSQLAFEFE
jgi:DNA adenine methylase